MKPEMSDKNLTANNRVKKNIFLLWFYNTKAGKYNFREIHWQGNTMAGKYSSYMQGFIL
jgi:hypothetical protein